MELILASRNKKKIKEMEDILATHFPGIRILSLDDVGYVGDIEENGETYEENALTKARTAVEAGGNRYAAIADDSGLSVDALNGAPGVYSARYAGGHGDDAANNALLLKNLAHIPASERTARFVCCIALVYPDGREMTVRGETEGVIINGFKDADGITINLDSPKAWDFIVGHEVTHALEGTAEYTALADAVKAVREEAEFVVGRHENGKRRKEEVGIHSLRLGGVVGEHEVIITTGNETISLKHEAHSRAVFADGGEYRGFYMHSAGNIRVTAKNTGDAPAELTIITNSIRVLEKLRGKGIRCYLLGFCCCCFV